VIRNLRNATASTVTIAHFAIVHGFTKRCDRAKPFRTNSAERSQFSVRLIPPPTRLPWTTINHAAASLVHFRPSIASTCSSRHLPGTRGAYAGNISLLSIFQGMARQGISYLRRRKAAHDYSHDQQQHHLQPATHGSMTEVVLV
jgi:hypothetical protein